MTPSSLADSEFVACPPDGRRVVRRRRVRLGDVTASGRLRLDALARYLQDVASDDVDEAGIERPWVLRRSVLRFGDLPRFRDDVELATFCSGTGGRLAERRTVVSVGSDIAIDVAAIWVYVDEAGRPARLEDWFFDVYGTAAKGRAVRGRLQHAAPGADAETRAWPLRRADVDVLAHVNNSIAWAAMEDVLDAELDGRRLVGAEVEYRAAIDIDDDVMLAVQRGSDRLTCWLIVGGDVRTSVIAHIDHSESAQVRRPSP
jgi:acyl-ACP thioesterase